MNIFGTDLMRKPGMWGGLPPMAAPFPQGGSQIYSGANPGVVNTPQYNNPQPMPQGPVPGTGLRGSPQPQGMMTKPQQRKGMPAFGGLPPIGAL